MRTWKTWKLGHISFYYCCCDYNKFVRFWLDHVISKRFSHKNINICGNRHLACLHGIINEFRKHKLHSIVVMVVVSASKGNVFNCKRSVHSAQYQMLSAISNGIIVDFLRSVFILFIFSQKSSAKKKTKQNKKQFNVFQCNYLKTKAKQK